MNATTPALTATETALRAAGFETTAIRTSRREILVVRDCEVLSERIFDLIAAITSADLPAGVRPYSPYPGATVTHVEAV